MRSRLEQMRAEKQLVRALPGVVKAMEKSMASMDLQSMTNVMDKFSQQFEDLEVQSEFVGETMSSATASMTPQSDVDALISMTADEHALDISTLMPGFERVDPSSTATALPTAKTKSAIAL